MEPYRAISRGSPISAARCCRSLADARKAYGAACARTCIGKERPKLETLPKHPREELLRNRKHRVKQLRLIPSCRHKTLLQYQ